MWENSRFLAWYSFSAFAMSKSSAKMPPPFCMSGSANRSSLPDAAMGCLWTKARSAAEERRESPPEWEGEEERRRPRPSRCTEEKR